MNVTKNNKNNSRTRFGIFDDCSYVSAKTTAGMEAPETSSGILSYLGFTLVELLVVVLIIGILAAIAVSQYKKSVERTKQSKALHFVGMMVPVLEQYYAENGAYANSFDQLPIAIPKRTGCKGMPNSTDATYVGGVCLHLVSQPRGIRAYFEGFQTGTPYDSRQVGKGYGYLLANSFYSLKKGWYCFVGTNVQSQHCKGTRLVDNAYGKYYSL